MESKKKQLKDKVVALVKEFLTNEGGITPYDLQILFGSYSLANNENEVATALARLSISLQ
ncbi:MAG: hypothetical protein ACLQED_07050 [Desulfobaccales bacterium]